MERLPALEVVAVNGVGTDAVDLAYARSRGLPVTGTFGALTEDVADMALGLLLATCRHLGAVDRFVRGGLWPKFPQPGALPLARRVSGMRVGIVGLGRVGRAVAERVGAFGCPVRYTDLKEIPGVAWAFEADLVQLARDSDALIVCAAADQARDLVDAAVLDALGPRGFLINVARGRLVKEADLVRALQERRIAGAAGHGQRHAAGPPRQRHRGDARGDGTDGAGQPGPGAGRRAAGAQSHHLRWRDGTPQRATVPAVMGEGVRAGSGDPLESRFSRIPPDSLAVHHHEPAQSHPRREGARAVQRRHRDPDER